MTNKSKDHSSLAVLKAELAQIRFEYETVKSELKCVTNGRDYCIERIKALELELKPHRNMDTCSNCNWTNCGCLNAGKEGEPIWLCHACIKLAVDKLQKSDMERDQARAALRLAMDFVEGAARYSSQW